MGKLVLIAVFATALIGWRGASTRAHSARELWSVAPRGAVFGRVTVSAQARRPPTSLSPYARRRYVPPQDPGVPGGAEDAFVYLEPLDASRPAPSGGAARMVQRDRTILPHVSVVQVGQTVEFPNEDNVFHNLFSLSPGNRFSLGRYKPGVTKTNRFDEVGVVRLFCDIHSEMAGVVLVVSTPYVARAGSEGEYRLSGIPAGEYRAIAWHPTAGADTVALTVGGGQEASLDFALPARR